MKPLSTSSESAVSSSAPESAVSSSSPEVAPQPSQATISANGDFSFRYHKEALPLFRQRRYVEALELFRTLYPQASEAKDHAAILTNMAKCLDTMSSAGATEILALMEPYATVLWDDGSPSWPIQPAIETFEIFVRACHQGVLDACMSMLSDYRDRLPQRFHDAFLSGISLAFHQEATRLGVQGHEQRVLAMGNVYLALTEGSVQHTATRVAIRNRMADTLVFSTSASSESIDRMGLLPSESLARTWLLTSLQEQPEHLFAQELKKHLEQRGHFRMQIARFWHDIRNRIAPLKMGIRRLRDTFQQSVTVPESLVSSDAVSLSTGRFEAVREIVLSLEKNVTWIDTALRVSGASHGIQDVFQPDAASFSAVDPATICREILEEEQLPTGRIEGHGAPRLWDIAQHYLRLTLANLLSNTREAYQRRQLDWPDPAVQIDIDYDQGTIQLRDWAGGIAASLEDPFAPYASTKDNVQMGAGLGLVQARAAIEQQGGRLFLQDSQPPDGAVFVIQFREF